jgi:hypothetical protein
MRSVIIQQRGLKYEIPWLFFSGFFQKALDRKKKLGTKAPWEV